MAKFAIMERAFENLGNRTISESCKACEHGQRHPFALDTENSVFLAAFLRQRSAARRNSFRAVTGAFVRAEPLQRMAGRASPPMTKITAMAGLEGFWVERCKVPVYSLSVQCVGDSTDSASIPPLIGIISGCACRDSPSSSSPAPAFPT